MTAHLSLRLSELVVTLRPEQRRRLGLPKPSDRPRMQVTCASRQSQQLHQDRVLCGPDGSGFVFHPNGFHADVQFGPKLWYDAIGTPPQCLN